MQNVRIKHFYDTEQIQIFSHAQRQKGEVYKKKIDRETGEIFPLERGHLEYNPFTEKLERMTEYKPLPPEEVARKSCSRTINAIYDIARCDRWEWFVTLTFNGERVKRYEYDECVKKLHNWLMNMRKLCPDMVYVVVPEQHKDGAFHFHGLFKNCDGLDFHFSGKRDKKGRRIYNVGKYKWGWTTATRITDFRRASSYLCKYITKELCAVTKGRKRYWCSKNVNRPIVYEFLLDGDYNERILEIMKDCSQDAYIKQIETRFTSVTYIDQSIPQTHESL